MSVIDCSKCIHCEVCGDRYASDGYAGECFYFLEHNPQGEWIPVSERLPDDYTKVLITNEYGIVTCVNWNTWYQNEYKDAKKEYKAIAWRRLPKPYESEGE